MSDPQAFPSAAGNMGMSLRDWFAGQIAAAMFSGRAMAGSRQPSVYMNCASDAYVMADALLAVRDGKSFGPVPSRIDLGAVAEAVSPFDEPIVPADPPPTSYRLCWRNVYNGVEGRGEWKAHLTPRETRLEQEQFVDDREYWVETKGGGA